MGRLLFVLDDIQHLDGGFDGGFGLVGIEGTGAVCAVVVGPGNGGLDEGVGAASWWNADLIVGEPGECAVETVFVDVADGMDEGVVHTVAHGRVFKHFAIDFELDGGHWAQSVGGGDHVGDELHLVVGGGVFEHVGHDVGEVFLRDELLLVAEFDDSVGHATGLLWREFQTEFLEVLEDVRLAGILAEGIFTFSAETLGQEIIAIEVVLVVAIGMNACHLCEDILSDDGLVRWNDDAREALDHRGDLAEILLIDVGLHLGMVVEDGLHGREWGIASTFTKTIHSGVNASTTSHDRCEDIARGEVVVVVGMEIEMKVGIAGNHLIDKDCGQLRVEDAERVGQHESLHAAVLEGIDQAIDIVGTVLHAVRPVLQIEVDIDVQLFRVVDAPTDVRHMFFEGLLQLELAMTLTALAEQVDVAASAVVNPIERGLAIDKPQHFNPVEHVALTSPSADALHSFLFPIRHTCRCHFDAIHIQFGQEHAGNQQLLVRHKAHAVGLFAIAERRVHDFYELFHTFFQFVCKVT